MRGQRRVEHQRQADAVDNNPRRVERAQVRASERLVHVGKGGLVLEEFRPQAHRAGPRTSVEIDEAAFAGHEPPRQVRVSGNHDVGSRSDLWRKYAKRFVALVEHEAAILGEPLLERHSQRFGR